jgi:hypothetical protein
MAAPTTQTATAKHAPRAPTSRLLYTAGAIGLMTTWFLFATGEALYGDLDQVQDLGLIADASGRFAAGALLELLAAIMLLPGVVVLMVMLRERAPRLSLVGGWLALTGAVGVGAFAQFHLLLLAMTDPTLDQVAMNEFASGTLSESAGLWGIPIMFVLVALPLGLLLLAVGLARAGITSAVPAWLIGVYVAVHLLIPNEWTEVGSHYLLAATLAWIGVVVLRRRDVLAT